MTLAMFTTLPVFSIRRRKSEQTLKDIEDANYLAWAVHLHYASSDPKAKHQVELITEMYHLAVKNAYYNTTCLCHSATGNSQNPIKIKLLEDKIEGIECDITTSCASSISLDGKIDTAQTTADNAQTIANTTQTIANTTQTTAKNALIANQNGCR
ncbi:hypothetical protein EDD18DRAFT_1108994 [Armillaria luteobubalina]|uniref:Uncharacterized protein n=1 Tax=Armillaria luteobubalina TaxID=153913 RepID=A0AA39UJQ7_9AGAR|nr:hypothetical protein EDD18DRAFT_1108994 [Armillaria luteobubalina]